MELLSRYAPTYEELTGLRPEWHRIHYDREYPEFGNYHLCERIPCGADDECYYAVQRGLAGFTKPCFLRRFPAELLIEPRIEAIKQRFQVNERGVEAIYELAVDQEQKWGFLVSEFIEGLNLSQLGAELDRERRTLPWSVALALLCDAGRLLDVFHRESCCHPMLTPARVRVSLRGMIYLCHGVLAGRQPLPVTREEREADHRSLLAAVLPLALTPDRREQLQSILTTDDTRAIGVLWDYLLERASPPAEPLLAVLLGRFPEAGISQRRPPSPEEVRLSVLDILLPEDARALWRLVLNHSPDLKGGYEPLGEPR